jgi:hypothetical protein
MSTLFDILIGGTAASDFDADIVELEVEENAEKLEDAVTAQEHTADGVTPIEAMKAAMAHGLRGCAAGGVPGLSRVPAENS